MENGEPRGVRPRLARLCSPSGGAPAKPVRGPFGRLEHPANSVSPDLLISCSPALAEGDLLSPKASPEKNAAGPKAGGVIVSVG